MSTSKLTVTLFWLPVEQHGRVRKELQHANIINSDKRYTTTNFKIENMSRVPTRAKNKKNLDTQGKEKNWSINKSKLTPEEASMASFQSSLDGISRQFKHCKMKWRRPKNIQRWNYSANEKLTKLMGDIDQKFAKITTGIGEHEKICVALSRTEELESWSYESNGALQDIMQEQKKIMDKLDNLESRSRRNNLRVYGIQEEAVSKSDSVAQFMDKRIREEFNKNLDLQIQRAHRDLAPKPKTSQPPRAIIINFHQLTVKEMILKKYGRRKQPLSVEAAFVLITITKREHCNNAKRTLTSKRS